MSFVLKVSLAVFVLMAAVVRAEPNEEQITHFTTKEIVELKAFYDAIDALSKTDGKLKALRFRPGQVALAGGFCREATAYLKNHPGATGVPMQEVHNGNRDLDIVIMTPIADPADQAYVKDVVTRAVAEHLSDKGVKFRNLDISSLDDKRKDPSYERQGFDSISQALISPTGVHDTAEALGMQPRINALHSLLTGVIDYELPATGDGSKGGVLQKPEEFLHQLIEVFRILKIRAELKGAVSLTAEADANIGKVLREYMERKDELETYLATDQRGGYFKNRIRDVVAGILDESEGEPSPEFKQLDRFFKFSELSPVAKALKDGASRAHVLSEIPGATFSPPQNLSVHDGTKQVALGPNLVFDPVQKKLFRPSHRWLVPTLVEITFPQGLDPNGAVTTTAHSGSTAPVDPVALPLDEYQVVKVEPLDATHTLVLVKNKTYRNIAILDTSGSEPEMKFLNQRAFSPDVAYFGAQGGGAGGALPIIPIMSFAVENGEIYAVRSDRVVSKLSLQSSGSFKFERMPFEGPRGVPVISMAARHGTLYFLQENGDLTSSDGAGNHLVMAGVSSFVKDDMGRLLAVVEKGKGHWVARLLEPDKKGYAEVALSHAPSAGGVLELPGRIDPVITPRVIKPGHAVLANQGAQQSLRRPVSDILKEVETLRAKWPQDVASLQFFDDFFKAKIKPELLTKPGDGAIASFVAPAHGDAALREKTAEAVYLRILLELKRGTDPAFPFLPNSFVLKDLIAAASELDNGAHASHYAALSETDMLHELLIRDDTAPMKWRDNKIPNWTSFTTADLAKLAQKLVCLADVKGLVGVHAAAAGH